MSRSLKIINTTNTRARRVRKLSFKKKKRQKKIENPGRKFMNKRRGKLKDKISGRGKKRKKRNEKIIEVIISKNDSAKKITHANRQKIKKNK